MSKCEKTTKDEVLENIIDGQINEDTLDMLINAYELQMSRKFNREETVYETANDKLLGFWKECKWASVAGVHTGDGIKVTDALADTALKYLIALGIREY
jgi:hypothetical protein